MISFFTPIQKAQFYLKVEFHHKSILKLKAMWDSLKCILLKQKECESSKEIPFLCSIVELNHLE